MRSLERIETEEIGRGVVPGRHVRVSGEAARVGVLRPVTPCAEPKVDLVKEGDAVVAIDVTCTCGQRLRLRCLYS